MKTRLVLLVTLAILSCNNLLYSQSPVSAELSNIFHGKTTLSFVYSFGGNDLYSADDIVGGPSYYGKGFFSIGAIASFEVMKNLDIVSGITYIRNRFEKTGAPIGVPQTPTNESIGVVNIPIFAKYHFLKFLYVGGGPVVCFNNGDRDLNGIGAEAHFGAEYNFKSGIVISFGPYMRIQGLLPSKEYRLFNSGVKFGLGYRF